MISHSLITDYQGHSADVQITLRLNGLCLKVAQLGPDFLILAERLEHPPAAGEIILRIDAHERRMPVLLPHGSRTDMVRVPLQSP